MMLIAARGLVGSWARWAKAQAIPATLVHVVQGILQPHRLPGAKPKRRKTLWKLNSLLL